MAAILASYGNVSAAGVVVFIVILISTGRLVPRRVYKDMESQRDHWEEQWNILQRERAESFRTERQANTEALRTVQASFESVIGRKREADPRELT